MSFILGAVPLAPKNLLEALRSGLLSDQVLSLKMKVDLLVFPECSLTGYYPRDARVLAKTFQKPFHDLFSELSSRLQTNVLAGAFRITPGGVENQAVLFSSTGLEVIAYSKVNLFRLAGEDSYLTSGDASVSIPVGSFSVSPKVCYDLRFPLCFYDQTPDVDLFAVIANWPATRRRHWEALLEARAIESEAYVLGVNRTGTDSLGNEYLGSPLLFDPTGAKCTPFEDSPSISMWSLNERSIYETVGSTIGKLKS